MVASDILALTVEAWAIGALAPILAGGLIATGAILASEMPERAAPAPAPQET